MKTLNLITCTLTALTITGASLVFADQTQPYRYGQKLDVQKVISLEEAPSKRCQVIDATMVYRDSTGIKRAVAYRKLSNLCWKQH